MPNQWVPTSEFLTQGGTKGSTSFSGRHGFRRTRTGQGFWPTWPSTAWSVATRGPATRSTCPMSQAYSTISSVASGMGSPNQTHMFSGRCHMVVVTTIMRSPARLRFQWRRDREPGAHRLRQIQTEINAGVRTKITAGRNITKWCVSHASNSCGGRVNQ